MQTVVNGGSTRRTDCTDGRGKTERCAERAAARVPGTGAQSHTREERRIRPAETRKSKPECSAPLSVRPSKEVRINGKKTKSASTRLWDPRNQ